MTARHLKTAFSLGQIVGTPGAMSALDESGESARAFITRHARRDWGDVCEEDGQLNDAAIKDGSRILSSYKTKRGIKMWVITEAADDHGQRMATTILLPEEY